MKLISTQIEQYRAEGYLLLPGLLSKEKRARFTAVFDALVDRARSLAAPEGHFSLAPDAEGKPIPGLLHKVQGVCVVDGRVLELARDPGIVDAVESLIGGDIDVFGTKFFPMQFAGATSTGWHQDNYYFGTQSDRVVSCAIYLEPMTRENGCLQVVPRSHLAGSIAEHRGGEGVYAHGAWSDVAEEDAVDILCPPGSVVLFSANLLHGARPNLTGRPSYRTAWHYIPADLDLPMFPRGVYEDRHLVRGK